MDLLENTLAESRQRVRAAGSRNAAVQDAGGYDVPFYPAGSVAGSTMSTFGLTTQSYEQYRHNTGWVHSCVRAIAQRIAGQPVHVAIKRKTTTISRAAQMWNKQHMPTWLKSSAQNLAVLPEHPFLDAIDNPNDIMPRWSFLFVTVASFLITGKSFWWMYRSNKGDMQLWPIPTHWISPKQGTTKVFEAWEIRPYGAMTSITVPGNEICFFHSPDPGNPLGSISTLQAQARPIIVNELSGEAQKHGYLNGMFPELAVTIGRPDGEGAFAGASQGRPTLTDKQRNDIIAAFRSRFRGIHRSGEVLILDQFIQDVKFLTRSNNEMAFAQTEKMTKDQITQGFGVNPIIMGQIEGANKASSAMAEEHVATNTVNPLINLLSNFMTIRALPAFDASGNATAFIEQASSYDPNLVLAQFDNGLKSGAVSVNEYREHVLKLPPVEGGDVTYRAMNMQPSPMTILNIQGDFSSSAEQGPDSEEDTAALSAYEAKSRVRAGGYNCIAKGISRQTLGRAWKMNLESAQNRFQRTIAAFLHEQAAKISKEARRAIGEHGTAHASVIADLAMPAKSSFTEQLKAAMRSPMRNVMTAGAAMEWQLYRPRSVREMADMTRKDWYSDTRTAMPQSVVDAIEKYLDDMLDQGYWGDVTEQIREQIVKAIETGIEDGESGPDVANGISELLGGDADVRAANIARTELTGALNAGAQSTRELLAENGLVVGKEWLDIDDERTRETHAEANGQQVGVDEPFIVGGEEAAYPGAVTLSAEERCNCFLPGAVVAGQFDTAMRSFYDGEAVEIVMRSGRRLSLTPNHPVLTKNGFVGAGELDSGDKVISYNGQVNATMRRGASCDDIDDVPAKIEQVFESFMLGTIAGICPSVEVRRSQVNDFHGDGQFVRGNVKIVRANRKLLLDGESSKPQEICNTVLKLKNAESSSVFRLGNSAFGVFGNNSVRSGLPSCRALPLNGGAVGFDFVPLDVFRFGSAAYLNASLFESQRNDVSGNAVFVGHGLEGHSASVIVDDGGNVNVKPSRRLESSILEGSINRRDTAIEFQRHVGNRNAGLVDRDHFADVWQRDFLAANRNASSGKKFVDRSGSSVELSSNLLDRHPGLVEVDEVLFVRRFDFCGHVYDLQSPVGYIVANGIVTSNCRCTSLSVMPADDAEMSDEGKAFISRCLKGEI